MPITVRATCGISIRSFTTSTTRLAGGPNPTYHNPPSRSNDQQSPDQDKQSSASTASGSGDDHPAKQPDPQEKPSRSTGFGAQEEVKKGDQSQRTDK